jgi:hypothetical protein
MALLLRALYRTGSMREPLVASRGSTTPPRDPRSERGGVGIREMIALLAVAITILAATAAILEVAGFDVIAWLEEQFGESG